jgi:hypothetical protein
VWSKPVGEDGGENSSSSSLPPEAKPFLKLDLENPTLIFLNFSELFLN